MKKFYFFFLAVLFGALITSQSIAQVNVTFQVDMQEQVSSPLGVHIAGSFPPPYPSWNPGGIALSPVGTIYSVTLSLMPGTNIEFKYLNGNAWGQDEAVPACCAQNNNRYFTVPEQEITIPLVCYGSCMACNANPTLRDITFQVDLSDVTYTTGAFIAGTLQDPVWTPEPMTAMGNDVFEITIPLLEGECYQYKFVIDGTGWEIVPVECRSSQENRYVEIPDFNQTLDLVCFNSCNSCDAVDVTFRVDMTNESVTGGVFIAGSFNGWNSTANPLTDMGSNIWETTITLQNGQDIEHKFINGTEWEIVPAACAWGDGNRHFVVSETVSPLDLVCFGSCNACSPASSKLVTFVVDMSSQIISGTGVFLAGDFNGWSMDATPMIENGNKIYEAEVSLGEGFIYGYKFINGDQWENVPAECNYNEVRTVIGPATNTTLPGVCFNECDECTTTMYRFDLSVNLEGPFNVTAIDCTMYDNGFIPLVQPYNAPPWNYPGTEQLTALPDAPVVDWVYVQFRETTGGASTATGATVVDHQAALLLADGTIARPDGSPGIYWNGNVADNLYVVIHHRNHLSVMNATPLVEVSDIFSYNFKDALEKAYLNGQKDLGGGNFGMFGGDINGDGIIDAADILEWQNHAGHEGYNPSDADADTQINNFDKNDVWLINLNKETKVPE